jgi:hypothetical protein
VLVVAALAVATGPANTANNVTSVSAADAAEGPARLPCCCCAAVLLLLSLLLLLMQAGHRLCRLCTVCPMCWLVGFSAAQLAQAFTVEEPGDARLRCNPRHGPNV